MEIKNYKYIQHTITPRKWGTECQFTVIADEDGRYFDDVISIPSTKIEEKELQTLIENKLMQLSVKQIPDIPPKEISGEEVETYLRDNLIIKSKHTLDMVKTAMAKVANAGV